MRKRILNLLLIIGCGTLLTGMVFQVSPADLVTPSSPAKVNLEGQGKAKRGKTITLQVSVDMTGATAPGTNQPASLSSYVIPISFDRNVLEFVSAGGGQTSAFSAGPASVTNPQTANASGLLTLVGSQTASDTVTGVVGIAEVTFRVVAQQKGKSTVSVNSELGGPGLSLASPARSGAPSDPYRIAAIGQSGKFKIK